MVGRTPGGLAKTMGGSSNMEGRYRPWEDKAIVGGGSALGGGVEAVMLFSTVEGGVSGGEKGQPGERRQSGGGVKARIERGSGSV